MSERTLSDLSTPVLLLDWPAARRNLERAAAAAAAAGVRLRPHFKNHKCVRLALEQVRTAPCAGMTAATVAELEALVQGGVQDVLLANQVVTPGAARRVLDAARVARVAVLVDDLENAADLAGLASARGQTLTVLVELDIGLGRCGLPPDPAAVVAFVERLARLTGLRFGGLQAYHGSAGHLEPAARARFARESMEAALVVRRAVESAGFACETLSGMGASTYRYVADLPGIDEWQLGSYVTMDWWYRERLAPEFELALSVLSTVLSVCADRVVLDVGAKGLAHEFGPPRVWDAPDARVPKWTLEEHTVAYLPTAGRRRGDRLRLLPSHCCGTCNLYRELVLHDGDAVLDVWPIRANGYTQPDGGASPASATFVRG